MANVIESEDVVNEARLIIEPAMQRTEKAIALLHQNGYTQFAVAMSVMHIYLEKALATLEERVQSL